MTYVNHGSLTAIGILFPVLGLISLVARLYGRCKYALSLGIDDVLAILASILDVAGGVAMVYGAQRNLIGGHTDQSYQEYVASSARRQTEMDKLEYAFWIYHAIAIGIIKLTILFFFRRLFRGRVGWTGFDFVNWFLVGFATVCMTLFMLLNIFLCRTSFCAAWRTGSGTEHDRLKTWDILVSTAIVNFAMDLAIFIFPIVIVGKLHMNITQKLQTCLIFAVSLFAVIAGLLRMIVFVQLVENGAKPKGDTFVFLGEKYAANDHEGGISLILFWTYMEIGVSFPVACLPSCGKVIVDVTIPIREKLGSLTSLIFGYSSGSEGKAESTVSAPSILKGRGKGSVEHSSAAC